MNNVLLRSELQYAPVINGDDNSVDVGVSCRIGAVIEISGNNNVVIIEDRVQYNQGWLGIRANGARIFIGSATTIGGAVISAHEAGNITIGRDCQMSVDVFMDISDMHPIFDLADKTRINPAADIVIEDHAWIGFRVVLTKGSTVGTGAIVGASSVVTGIIPANSLAVGNPARIIRENVAWERSLNSPGPGIPGFP